MPACSRIAERAPSAATRSSRRNRLAAGSGRRRSRSACCSKPVTASARSSTPSAFALLDQRVDQQPVLDHVRERLRPARPRRRRSGTSAAPRRSSLESVTTMSRIGCALVRDRSQTPIASNSRRAAAAIAEARASLRLRRRQRRIGDRHREGVAQRLAQRDGEREAGKAAAADQHIAPRMRHAVPSYCTTRNRPAERRSYPSLDFAPCTGVIGAAIKKVPPPCPPPSRTCSTSSTSNSSR